MIVRFIGAREIKTLSRSKAYRPDDEFTDFTRLSETIH